MEIVRNHAGLDQLKDGKADKQCRSKERSGHNV